MLRLAFLDVILLANLNLGKMKQDEDEYVKQTIEVDQDKKMKMSNKTVEEDKSRPMDFAMY